MKKPQLRTSSRYRLTSWVYIAVIVLILIVLNIGANLIPFQIDFTPNKTFSLSGECRNMIQSVEQDVEIIACDDRINYSYNIYRSNVAETIENMAAASSHIEASFKNIEKNPALKAEYPQIASLSTSDILVRLKADPSKYRQLSLNDLFEYDSSARTITESKVEYYLANAIDYCTRSEFPTLYITTNHSEDTPNAFLSLLRDNNYTVQTLNLLSSPIPADADYLFVFNPKTDFSAAETEKLESFLSNGGNLGKNLLVFMSPEQTELPYLETFLAEWGLAAETGMIYNTQYSIDTDYESILLGISDTTVLGSLSPSINILSEQTRPLSLLFQSRDYSSTKALLSALPSSQLIADPGQAKDPASDSRISAPVLAMGTRYVQNSSVQSHVVVSGSYKLISDAYISDSNIGNAAYLAQLIKTLDPDNTKLCIFPKSMQTPLLSFSGNTEKTVALVVFVVVLPLAVAGAGVAVYLKRRHR